MSKLTNLFNRRKKIPALPDALAQAIKDYNYVIHTGETLPRLARIAKVKPTPLGEAVLAEYRTLLTPGKEVESKAALAVAAAANAHMLGLGRRMHNWQADPRELGKLRPRSTLNALRALAHATALFAEMAVAAGGLLAHSGLWPVATSIVAALWLRRELNARVLPQCKAELAKYRQDKQRLAALTELANELRLANFSLVIPLLPAMSAEFRRRNPEYNHRASTGVRVGPTSAISTATAQANEQTTPSAYPSVNVTGMPMIPGTCIDVTGQPYGM